ncbi:hypothetical protein N9374_03430 [Candidatus Pelagibacter sp.]|nr:hypothetical protein [Candidatus Pelagibacter sp.]
MNKILRLLYIFTLIVLPTNAFAYLDPGTGSIILQAILGFIAATIASVSIYWTKFKSLISKLFNKKKENKK